MYTVNTKSIGCSHLSESYKESIEFWNTQSIDARIKFYNEMWTFITTEWKSSWQVSWIMFEQYFLKDTLQEIEKIKADLKTAFATAKDVKGETTVGRVQIYNNGNGYLVFYIRYKSNVYRSTVGYLDTFNSVFNYQTTLDVNVPIYSWLQDITKELLISEGLISK